MATMTDWCPFAIENRAPSALWGRYASGPFRGVLHTTETSTFKPHPTLYGGWHTSYPHFTILRTTVGGAEEVRIYQHVPIGRAARALKNLVGGARTNAESAVQIEIVWSAAIAPDMPKVLLDGLARLMRWIESQTGIPRTACDGFHFYPPEGGHRLGREPWRMSEAAWDRFAGWCGHQHVPENVHGDPGKIDIASLLGSEAAQLTSQQTIGTGRIPVNVQEELLMTAALSDDDARLALIRQWYHDYLLRPPESTEEMAIHHWVFASKGADACLAGISDSAEARAIRAAQRATIGLTPRGMRRGLPRGADPLQAWNDRARGVIVAVRERSWSNDGRARAGPDGDGGSGG